MAIIICPECRKEVSDKANQCIHCGYPLKKAAFMKLFSKLFESIIYAKQLNKKLCVMVLLVIFITIVLAFSIKSLNSPLYKAKKYYADRNIESYEAIKLELKKDEMTDFVNIECMKLFL